MYLTVPLMIIAGVSLGAAQLTSLTRNRDDDMIICAGEEVTYTCTAETQLLRLQWIVEPFVSATDLRRVVENINGTQGSTTTIGSIVIRYVSNDPFVTTLTINGATANTSSTVMCSTIGQSSNTVLRRAYTANDGPVEPVSGLSVRAKGSNLSEGFNFVATFNSSPSLDIDEYIVSCTDDNCVDIVVMGSSGTITATGRCIVDTACNVSVRAVNRCGKESPVESQRVEVACEFPAGVSSNVNISISGQQEGLYSVGAMLMYQCRTGFYPQDNVTAVCQSNTMWSPDPAQHTCTVDCGMPVFRSDSNGVAGNATSTTEGATVIFLCNEGLVLSSKSSDCTVIRCINNNDMGQWMPNPTELRCVPRGPDPVLIVLAVIAVLLLFLSLGSLSGNGYLWKKIKDLRGYWWKKNSETGTEMPLHETEKKLSS